MDGTHIATYILKSQVAAYLHWKGHLTQKLSAACTFSLYFYYVLSGWKGSAHDGRVFKDLLTKVFTVPNGKYYL